jgi:hypothetical protein
MYSDNGWQNLIDGLVKVAKNVGVRIILGEKVTKLKKTDSPGWQILLSNKTKVSAKIVVIAVGPWMRLTFLMRTKDQKCWSRLHKNQSPYA